MFMHHSHFFTSGFAHPAAGGRTMSKPRSSRRTSARIAAFHVDDEIEISSFRQRRESLRDRVSGAGPPTLSLIRNVDLTEVHTWLFR